MGQMESGTDVVERPASNCRSKVSLSETGWSTAACMYMNFMFINSRTLDHVATMIFHLQVLFT